MAEENHGWSIGWGFGGLIAALLFYWPASCVGQGLFGGQSVEYDSAKEFTEQIQCTNVFGRPRVELDQLQTFFASVACGALLGVLYEGYLWWRRSQAPPATGAT